MHSSDRSHILKLPKWLIFLRGAQMLVALLVFCLACYGASALAIDGDALSLFTSLATFILLTYIVGSELWFPFLYNYWAVLGLEIFAVFFWLVSFALLAAEVGNIVIVPFDDCFFDCIKRKRGLVKRDGQSFFDAMATEAAFGGVEFTLFIVSLVFVSIQLYRHRKEGGHCQPGALQTAPPSGPTVQTAAQWPTMPQVREEQTTLMQSQPSNLFPRAELPHEQQLYQQSFNQQPPQTAQHGQHGYNALPVAGRDDAYFENA